MSHRWPRFLMSQACKNHLLVLVTFDHACHHFLPLFFISVYRKQPFVPGGVGEAGSVQPDREGKRRGRIMMGTFIPFLGSWLRTILVVLTLNLKPRHPQERQEDRLLAHGLPKQHRYPLCISALLL